MANQLKMALVHTILSLQRLGWSHRRIARELDIHRETVARHIQLAGTGSKPATDAPPGSGQPAKPAKDAPLGSVTGWADPQPGKVWEASRDPDLREDGFIALPPPAEHGKVEGAVAEDRALLGSNLSAAATPYGTGGPDSVGAACLLEGDNTSSGKGGQSSHCEPYRTIILSKLKEGLTAQRIYQDLRVENGFEGSYYSVRRFVGRLGEEQPAAFRRMECRPGWEAQVDFGSGALIQDAAGRRRSHVFRIVLSHSRKGYSQAVFHQRTEDFLGCLENAFWHFGGVPQTVVIDNLRAAVTKADWYDPELNPRIVAFSEHYGTVILPTKPYTPRHKGKVERGIAYVQDNGLKGQKFASLGEQNRHLEHWEATIADTRIHGTTRMQVGKVFQESEKPALLPLPAGRLPFFQESQRSVHRDGHVEVAKAYYSVPPEYVGRQVWVRWDGHLVRIFNQQMEQISVHAQRESGKFSTQNQHIESRKVSAVEKGAGWILQQVSRIGPQTEQWAAAVLQARGIEGVRVLVGLNSLAKSYPYQAIEEACGKALSHGVFRLRILRELLKRDGGDQQQFDFLQEHEIIRDMSEYGQLVRASIRQEPAPLQPVES